MVPEGGVKGIATLAFDYGCDGGIHHKLFRVARSGKRARHVIVSASRVAVSAGARGATFETRIYASNINGEVRSYSDWEHESHRLDHEATLRDAGYEVAGG